MLARIGTRPPSRGDDGLLQAVIRVLGEEGFERRAPPRPSCRDIMRRAGPADRAAPDARARADIRRGIAVVRALGAADVGQGCVVQQGLVLGVEAIEGTDALLARCAGLRREGRAACW